ncbi:MAG: nucleotide exchange factor GrpE [Saccharospirillum sp.]|nr:nucleotide exchange factor GrpE [Saccharospirillum sp.]
MAHDEKTIDPQDNTPMEEQGVEFEQPEEAVEQTDPDTDLVAELEEARAEAKANADRYLRAEAEMANLRRRVEKDVENAHKYGQEKLVKELLDVADNLERTLAAIDSDSSEVEPLKEGVDMTLKGLLGTFAKFQIEVIDPEGEPFDPQHHQAMSMIENPEVEPNTVIAVMQKGYTLHGRLVRPAMVMVSKGAAGKTIDEKA